ncbi:MAG: hypothetical protein IPG85_17350 [Bacteroidetes bacterium]|nr:hypothetical protein [Bacteroidota bacterium]
MGARKNRILSSISDTAHVTIFENILNDNKQVAGSNLARFEKDTDQWEEMH